VYSKLRPGDIVVTNFGKDYQVEMILSVEFSPSGSVRVVWWMVCTTFLDPSYKFSTNDYASDEKMGFISDVVRDGEYIFE
jgi:hypothetical protein